MSYGDYSRFEPKTTQDNVTPAKIEKATPDPKQVDPKTSKVSHSILQSPKIPLEEADPLTRDRLTKPDIPPDSVSGRAHALGAPILLQSEALNGAMEAFQQEDVYAKQKIDSTAVSSEAPPPPHKLNIDSMNMEELAEALSQDLSGEEIDMVLQRMDELSALLNEKAVELNQESTQLNEESAQLDASAAKLDDSAIQLEEEAFQLEEREGHFQKASDEVVAEKTVGQEVVRQKTVQEIIHAAALVQVVGDLVVYDQEWGEYMTYSPDRHGALRGEQILSFNREAAELILPKSRKHEYRVGQAFVFEGQEFEIRKVRTFTKQELEEVMRAIAGQTPIVFEEEEEKPVRSHAGSPALHYREMDVTDRSPMQVRGANAVRQEQLSGASTSPYGVSTKKFLDDILDKNYKKIQMELKRLEREILSHEILIEGIKHDELTQSVQKSAQKFQELEAKNRALDAAYDAALQKFLDGLQNYRGEVPLPMIKKFKEIQVSLIRLGKLIPKEVSGDREMVKLIGDIVTFRKEVLTVMTGLAVAAGKLYVSGAGFERQSSLGSPL